MSRIGKKPVALPNGVSISVDAQNIVTVNGPKGTLTQKVDQDIIVSIEENELKVERPTEQKRHKALHGLYRSLINNMVIGVSTGYKAEMEIVGVGYKATNNGNVLDLSLGFSHNVYFVVPMELKVTTAMEKGKNPMVMLEGTDKQLVGLVASKIKSLRKVEPYKGKGIRFVGEVIRRKAGKTSGKKK